MVVSRFINLQKPYSISSSISILSSTNFLCRLYRHIHYGRQNVPVVISWSVLLLMITACYSKGEGFYS